MFLQLEERYRCNLNMMNVFPDYTFSTYEGETYISSNALDDGNFRLVLLSRKSIVDNPKESTVDPLLIELGECMFPISLKVDNYGNLLEVENYEEIKNRRVQKLEEMRKAYPITEFIKYLEISMNNLRNEECFRKKLESNLFIQILTNSLFPKKTFVVRLDNFPTIGKSSFFSCKAEENDLTSVKYNATSLIPSTNDDVLEGDINILLENEIFKETKAKLNFTKEDGDTIRCEICLSMEKVFYSEENKEEK